VRVLRSGLTVLKGARHVTRPWVDLTPDGPAGDRLFCLVDRSRARVLRTVENPLLVQAEADWDGAVLAVTVDGRRVAGVPSATGETVKVDYWGRQVALEVVDGPWAAACSAHVGREVTLTRSPAPGEVVYGAAVSLVTTSSLDRLTAECGRTVASERFRATFTVDTGDLPPYVEDGWLGTRVSLGEAEVEVRSALPRCAVVDLDPVTGRKDLDVLRTLGRYRRAPAGSGDVLFGVDAVVTRAGRVGTGDTVVTEGG
jgi:uncharacterized protein YcbX